MGHQYDPPSLKNAFTCRTSPGVRPIPRKSPPPPKEKDTSAQEQVDTSTWLPTLGVLGAAWAFMLLNPSITFEPAQPTPSPPVEKVKVGEFGSPDYTSQKPSPVYQMGLDGRLRTVELPCLEFVVPVSVGGSYGSR